LNWADQVNYTEQKAWKEAKNGYREYSFVIRTITLETTACRSVREFPYKTKIFRNRVREAIIKVVKWKE